MNGCVINEMIIQDLQTSASLFSFVWMQHVCLCLWRCKWNNWNEFCLQNHQKFNRCFAHTSSGSQSTLAIFSKTAMSVLFESIIIETRILEIEENYDRAIFSKIFSLLMTQLPVVAPIKPPLHPWCIWPEICKSLRQGLGNDFALYVIA